MMAAYAQNSPTSLVCTKLFTSLGRAILLARLQVFLRSDDGTVAVSARPWCKRSRVPFPDLASLFRLLSVLCSLSSFKYP